MSWASDSGRGLPLWLPGATTATRYAGATDGGVPTTGTFETGDVVIDVLNGCTYVCLSGGPAASCTWSGPIAAMVYTPNMYGAVGNGSDSTVAIQTADNNAAANGGVVFFPGGTWGYSQINATAGTRTWKGLGPEVSILQPTAAAVTPTLNFNFAAFTGEGISLEDLEVNLVNCPSLDAIYVHNTNKSRFKNVKVRQGRRQLWLGYVSQCGISDFYSMNPQSCGLHVLPPNPATPANLTGQQPNFWVDGFTYEATPTAASFAGDAAIWVNCFTAGFVLKNIWAIKGTSAAPTNGTMAVGIRVNAPPGSAPPSYSNGLGHFGLLTVVNTDGLDGPNPNQNAASAYVGVGLYCDNARQVQVTNSFLSARSGTLGGTGAGVQLEGTCLDIDLESSWISALGILVPYEDGQATPQATSITNLRVAGNRFPQTVAGGAIAAPLSGSSRAAFADVFIAPDNICATNITPDAPTAAVLLAAVPVSNSADPGGSSPPVFWVSDQADSQAVQFYNPNGPWSRYIALTSSGTLHFLSNASKVTFQIQDSGTTNWISSSSSSASRGVSVSNSSTNPLFNFLNNAGTVIAYIDNTGNAVFDGALATTPPASAAETVAFGTAFHNTLGYDLMLVVYAKITANTSLVVQVGVGPTSTPTQQTVITGSTNTGIVPIVAYVPNGSYCLISESGTGTIAIMGSQGFPI